MQFMHERARLIPRDQIPAASGSGRLCMMHKKLLRRYFSPQTLASQGVLAEKSSPRLCILCRNVHNRGLQQSAATSGLQTGCLGLCRIAIYQVANERAAHEWPHYVTPVHMICFACSGRIRRIFFAARRVASDKAGRARWAQVSASRFRRGSGPHRMLRPQVSSPQQVSLWSVVLSAAIIARTMRNRERSTLLVSQGQLSKVARPGPWASCLAS